jgi:hypothetical protein
MRSPHAPTQTIREQDGPRRNRRCDPMGRAAGFCQHSAPLHIDFPESPYASFLACPLRGRALGATAPQAAARLGHPVTLAELAGSYHVGKSTISRAHAR